MDRPLLLDNLIQYKPRIIQKNTRYAAVAIIVILGESNTELFLTRRTIHPNDPWSGQIGLPGGHQENHDANLSDTAIRETREETKIVLNKNHLVCQIDDQQGYAQGGEINLTVRPYVFVLNHRPVKVQINYELDRYYWLALSHFQSPQNHIFFDPMNTAQKRPGITIDKESVLWGMTYRILADFYSAIRLDSTFICDAQH